MGVFLWEAGILLALAEGFFFPLSDYQMEKLQYLFSIVIYRLFWVAVDEL